MERLDSSPRKALGAVARPDDRPSDCGNRVAVAAEARGKAADEPRIIRRHRADGNRRWYRLLRRNARSYNMIDEVECFISGSAPHQIQRPGNSRGHIGSGIVKAMPRPEARSLDRKAQRVPEVRSADAGAHGRGYGCGSGDADRGVVSDMPRLDDG